MCFNPTAPRKAKIVYNFGLSGCNRVIQEVSKTLKNLPLTVGGGYIFMYVFGVGQVGLGGGRRGAIKGLNYECKLHVFQFSKF